MNVIEQERRADQARAKGFCVLSGVALALIPEIRRIDGLGWVDASLARGTVIDDLRQLADVRRSVAELSEEISALREEIVSLQLERNRELKLLRKVQSRLGLKPRRRSTPSHPESR